MSLESERGAAGSLGSAALSGIRIPGQAGTVPGFHVGERVLVQLGRSHVGRSMSTATVAFLGEVRAPRNTSAQLHAPPPPPACDLSPFPPPAGSNGSCHEPTIQLFSSLPLFVPLLPLPLPLNRWPSRRAVGLAWLSIRPRAATTDKSEGSVTSPAGPRVASSLARNSSNTWTAHGAVTRARVPAAAARLAAPSRRVKQRRQRRRLTRPGLRRSYR